MFETSTLDLPPTPCLLVTIARRESTKRALPARRPIRSGVDPDGIAPTFVRGLLRGFVKSTQIRRAFEPARHFNGGQVFVLFATLILQAGVAAYVLLA